jgi:hypothetical protein
VTERRSDGNQNRRNVACIVTLEKLANTVAAMAPEHVSFSLLELLSFKSTYQKVDHQVKR